MARSSNVNSDQVAEACAALFLEGRNTSFDSVYELIGRRGSAKVVQGFIADWRKTMAERFVAGRTNPDLPEALVNAADQMLASVWKLALEHSDNAYAGQRELLTRERLDLEAQVVQSRERAAGFEKEVLTLQGDLQVRQTRLQSALEELEAQGRTLAEASTLLRAREEQIAQQREDAARLTVTLETERRQHEVELQGERQRHEEAIATERQRGHAAVQREREIAAGERQFLMRQTDDLRQAAKAAETSLKEQLVEAKTYGESYRSKAGKAEGDAAYWKGKAEASAEDADRARQASIAASSRHETLQAQVQSLTAQKLALSTQVEKLTPAPVVPREDESPSSPGAETTA